MTAEGKFREAAARVVDLVLTDDCVYLDNLPDAVEIEIVTPLAQLGSALRAGTAEELTESAGLFLDCAAFVAPKMPQDLAEAVDDLRAAFRGYTSRRGSSQVLRSEAP
ncbi:hypothetical protein ACIO8G_25280 [Streptomyces sp. NPDC087219]|uniref:hypothetical protein n=1 Tax=Streptomyces sp. NPDC087219 TaxID=3365770 RepID=UPI0037F7347A